MNFHKAFRISFFTAAGAALLACFAAVRRSSPAMPGASLLPPEFVDASVLTPEEAKIKRLFWSAQAGAIRLLENPELFDSVFPGYGPIRDDGALWNRYFQEIFDQGLYSPEFLKLPGASSLQITTSWMGNFDIYRKYGADIMILGNSESVVSVSAGLLRDALDQSGLPGLRGKKILQCAKANFAVKMFADFLKNLDARHAKADFAVWGYSLGLAHRASEYEQVQRDQRAAINDWRSRNFAGRLNRRFPHPSWDIFAGSRRQEQASGTSPFLIPDKTAADPSLLEKHLTREGAPDFSLGIEEKDCDFSTASQDADLAIAQLLKISDKIIIFIAPTDSLNRRNIPSCLMPNLKAMLQSKAGPNVIVKTMDWESFGLSSRDYLHPSGQEGFRLMDPGHVNEAGARKVTTRVAQWVLEAASK